MIVVGLDPGLSCPAACIFHASDARIIAWKAWPQKRVKKQTVHYHKRISEITKQMLAWSDDYLPPLGDWIAAIEGPAFAAKGMHEQLAASRQSLFDSFRVTSLDDPLIVSPAEARRAVCGNGQAKKPMAIAVVRRMVTGEWQTLFEHAFKMGAKDEAGALADSYAVALAGARMIRCEAMKEG